MQGQLDEMKADQRPWVSNDIEAASDLTFDDSGGILRFRYTLRNIGRSPAFNVNAWPIILPSTPSRNILVTDPTRILKEHCIDVERKIKDLLQGDFFVAWGSILYPGEHIIVEEVAKYDIPKTDPQHFLTMIPASGPLYVISCIDYQSSIDGVHHQVGELYFLTANGSDLWSGSRDKVSKATLGLRPAQIWGTKYAN
jgi:hypothetical protein